MKIVGITGGIGSGKTTVCRIFASLGVPVFYADEEAKKLYDDAAVLKKMQEALGENILHEDGKLNRSLVASLIFNDPEKRTAVNNLIHPLVKNQFITWQNRQHYPYGLREAAILIESGAYKDCTHIIVVTAGMEERIERVMKRDGSSREDVEKRILAQMTEEERIKYADFTIYNNHEETLTEQVIQIHQQLIV